MSDEVFIRALRLSKVSDPPTKKQLDAMYKFLTDAVLKEISDFGVAELEQVIAAAKATR